MIDFIYIAEPIKSNMFIAIICSLIMKLLQEITKVVLKRIDKIEHISNLSVLHF